MPTTSTGRVRVLYVFCSQHPSGAEMVMERLLLANTSAVEPLALCPPGSFAERLRRQGITVRETTALLSLGRQELGRSRLLMPLRIIRRALHAAAAIRNAVRYFNPAVVHANNVSAASYALLAKMTSWRTRARSPVWLWTTQDLRYLVARDTSVARLCCRGFDATVAVSKSVADEYPECKAKLSIIYSGLDPAAWTFDELDRQSFRKTYNLRDDCIAIGLVGVISERKGHHILIPAFELLSKQCGRSLRLFLVGGSVPQYEEYAAKRRAETSGDSLRANVTWTGPIGTMRQAYCGLDIVVNCTVKRYGEPLGTTIYEAMACERVVLATQTGGSPEIINDGVDGYLCAPDDPAALAARLQFIVAHWDQMKKIRQAAREKVIDQFTIAEMAGKYNTLYNRLLQRS